MGRLTRGLAAAGVQLALGLAAASLGLAIAGASWSPRLAAAVAVAAVVVALEAGAQRGVDRRAPFASDRWLARATSLGVALGLIGGAFELALHGGRGQLAALVFALAGAALRARAIAALGDAFVSAAEPPPQLATSGIYAWVRHPSELGLLLVSLGFALAAPGPCTIVGLMVVAGSGALRVRREERVLALAFGRLHRDYARRVPALWPGVR
jgi:protein-S-isoprenylcysteine O-methyltransferase Ste14